MAVNVYIKKTDKTSSSDVLKKFQKKVKTSGVVNKLKSVRFFDRKASAYRKKKEALRRIQKTEEIERAKKLGKKA